MLNSIDYETPAVTRDSKRARYRRFVRLLCSIGLLITVIWFVTLPSLVVILPLRVAPNEAGIVQTIVRFPREDNADVEPFDVATSWHVSRVTWSLWRRGGWYVIVPKWMVGSIVAPICFGMVALIIRTKRQAPRVNQSSQATSAPV